MFSNIKKSKNTRRFGEFDIESKKNSKDSKLSNSFCNTSNEMNHKKTYQIHDLFSSKLNNSNVFNDDQDKNHSRVNTSLSSMSFLNKNPNKLYERLERSINLQLSSPFLKKNTNSPLARYLLQNGDENKMDKVDSKSKTNDSVMSKDEKSDESRKRKFESFVKYSQPMLSYSYIKPNVVDSDIEKNRRKSFINSLHSRINDKHSDTIPPKRSKTFMDYSLDSKDKINLKMTKINKSITEAFIRKDKPHEPDKKAEVISLEQPSNKRMCIRDPVSMSYLSTKHLYEKKNDECEPRNEVKSNVVGLFVSDSNIKIGSESPRSKEMVLSEEFNKKHERQTLRAGKIFANIFGVDDKSSDVKSDKKEKHDLKNKEDMKINKTSMNQSDSDLLIDQIDNEEHFRIESSDSEDEMEFIFSDPSVVDISDNTIDKVLEKIPDPVKIETKQINLKPIETEVTVKKIEKETVNQNHEHIANFDPVQNEDKNPVSENIFYFTKTEPIEKKKESDLPKNSLFPNFGKIESIDKLEPVQTILEKRDNCEDTITTSKLVSKSTITPEIKKDVAKPLFNFKPVASNDIEFIKKSDKHPDIVNESDKMNIEEHDTNKITKEQHPVSLFSFDTDKNKKSDVFSIEKPKTEQFADPFKIKNDENKFSFKPTSNSIFSNVTSVSSPFNTSENSDNFALSKKSVLFSGSNISNPFASNTNSFANAPKSTNMGSSPFSVSNVANSSKITGSTNLANSAFISNSNSTVMAKSENTSVFGANKPFTFGESTKKYSFNTNTPSIFGSENKSEFGNTNDTNSFIGTDKPFGLTENKNPFGGTNNKPFSVSETKNPFGSTNNKPFSLTETKNPFGSSENKPFSLTETKNPFGGSDTKPFSVTENSNPFGSISDNKFVSPGKLQFVSQKNVFDSTSTFQRFGENPFNSQTSKSDSSLFNSNQNGLTDPQSKNIFNIKSNNVFGSHMSFNKHAETNSIFGAPSTDKKNLIKSEYKRILNVKRRRDASKH
ncbi:hypothetical protein A3Q56_00040 [Intoshia linei]|uniref:Uncharacterized protein n=1 Tax=Intoshia linei TaxID=1819745 RepID=A0A177BF13_9BILA|nr:hypothetical protein A3Q56_00040 [Intoshia linei]